MDVNIQVTVGTFSCDVTVTNCGPDAVGDVLNQVTARTLEMVGAEAIHAAAGTVDNGGGDDDGVGDV